jgi:hypothetical protein
MSASREIRWKIDASYTAETMPLDRLAEYLKHLATMLGEPQHLHLIKMETASANAVLRVDGESVEHVRRRGDEVRRGTAPREAMESYRVINIMLQQDKGRATLYEGDAEIIPFRGGWTWRDQGRSWRNSLLLSPACSNKGSLTATDKSWRREGLGPCPLGALRRRKNHGMPRQEGVGKEKWHPTYSSRFGSTGAAAGTELSKVSGRSIVSGSTSLTPYPPSRFRTLLLRFAA